MKPKVFLHMGISLDGRYDWSKTPGSPYYSLIRHIQADSDLSGSNTMLAGFWPEDPEHAYPDLFAQYASIPPEERTRLFVVDSRGRIRNWHLIKRQPFWGSYCVLCSRATPQAYFDYLETEEIDKIICGEEQVDLASALETLQTSYGAKRIRVDSGGILNGALLRAGLVDEVNVIINPELVGGESPKTMFAAPDLKTADGVIPLKLEHLEKFSNDFVWLRYSVKRE